LSRFVTIGAKLRGRATRTVFDSAIHQYLQCLHETAADGLQRRWYRAQFALAWPGRVSEILVDSGGVGHGVHDARTDARRVVADIGRSGRPTVYAGVEPRSDSSLRWEGRLLLAPRIPGEPVRHFAPTATTAVCCCAATRASASRR
jgi:hypothetical protein